MNNMDTKLVAHVAAEVVVIGGISFYFNKRISALELENNILREKLNDIIKLVEKHESFLTNTFSQQPTKTPQPPSQPIRRPPPPEPEQESFFDEKELDEELKEEIENMNEDFDMMGEKVCEIGDSECLLD